MEHGRIIGVDCDSDFIDPLAPPVNPCTKYAEDPQMGVERRRYRQHLSANVVVAGDATRKAAVP
ncbi:hypothetical protein CK215_26370 [Mesorhizobium sp. WSM3864]|nr:hypothetical protein CK215_26370 [Mesorhizobium sp. WSM3864]